MLKGMFEAIARRTALVMLAAAVVLPAFQAQAAWPEKPIKIVLPFGAGSVADVTACILGDQLAQKLS
jgi:tripartite-type tricarboxylate transporter receptor subunit TctC